jgi:hypothetical protein
MEHSESKASASAQLRIVFPVNMAMIMGLCSHFRVLHLGWTRRMVGALTKLMFFFSFTNIAILVFNLVVLL